MTQQKITLAEIIGKHNLPTVRHIIAESKDHEIASKICDEIIKPRMEIINKITGQENDPKFLAYMVMYHIK